jgi:exodeoxyribonuclease VII large subunit
VRDGISILFSARITFDPVYGLSLRILDIDPSYSLGELEREKQEAIARLRKEGFFTMNRTLSLAVLPQRIAVISVESSKGFADFTTTINENPWKYRFFYMLFPSLLQGEKVTESIIGQLNRIEQVKHHFDAVAIIRGGGGDIGLAGFNNYILARRIATFPLPVITGIGHATNETVAEQVAYRNCITPTDLAGFLLQQFHNFSVRLDDASRVISDEGVHLLTKARRDTDELTASFFRSMHLLIRQNAIGIKEKAIRIRSHTNLYLRSQQLHLSHITRQTGNAAESFIVRRITDINQSAALIKSAAGYMLTLSEKEVGAMERQVSTLDPARVLARGYSITRCQGKVVTNAGDVNPGDQLVILTGQGSISGNVTGTNQHSQEITHTGNE